MNLVVLPVAIRGTNSRFVDLAIKACEAARHAAGRAADMIASGNIQHLSAIYGCESLLDEIDREMDEAVVFAISESTVTEARELLVCLKFVIDLERIGDLISSLNGRAQAIVSRLAGQDRHELVKMATVLERMILDAQIAFTERDVNRAVTVLRADAEIDRLRNLIFIRHIEPKETGIAAGDIQVLFMAQALERAGDHAKNLGEEVCHYVTGKSVRHILRSRDKSHEQMFLDWLRDKHEKSEKKPQSS
jgi:phosphate transport system protein